MDHLTGVVWLLKKEQDGLTRNFVGLALRSQHLAMHTENRQEQEETLTGSAAEDRGLLNQRFAQKYRRVKLGAEMEPPPQSERCPQRPEGE
jgi:hypothetical protein